MHIPISFWLLKKWLSTMTTLGSGKRSSLKQRSPNRPSDSHWMTNPLGRSRRWWSLTSHCFFHALCIITETLLHVIVNKLWAAKPSTRSQGVICCLPAAAWSHEKIISGYWYRRGRFFLPQGQDFSVLIKIFVGLDWCKGIHSLACSKGIWSQRQDGITSFRPERL